jgi:hypothetical protein
MPGAVMRWSQMGSLRFLCSGEDWDKRDIGREEFDEIQQGTEEIFSTYKL